MVSERERELLLKGIETARIKSQKMTQQGYRYTLSLPDGRACLPGIVCVHRPPDAPTEGGVPYYLVAITQTDPDDPASLWDATCDCEFHRRTEFAFGQGKGTCKHALWILKLFNVHLAAQPFVGHILRRSKLIRQERSPEPTSNRAAEQTTRVFERPRFAVTSPNRQTVPTIPPITPPARRTVPGSERDF